MPKSLIDANVNNSIFRKDYDLIIAMKRELAAVHGVRLKYNAAGWTAGQVLARDTADGLFGAYSALSGSFPAQMVLMDSVRAEEEASTGGALSRAISSGHVFTTRLIDYSSQAKTDLKARDVVDADGISVTQF